MQINVSRSFSSGTSHPLHRNLKGSETDYSRKYINIKASVDVYNSHISQAVSIINDKPNDISVTSSSGQVIETNRLLLALASPFLANLLEDIPNCVDPVLILPDISSEILIHLVRIIAEGFTTSHFGSSVSLIFQEIEDIMETAKVLDIAIVDLSYEDKNSFTPRQIREEETESMASEMSMEDDLEPVDSEMSLEYAFVKECEAKEMSLEIIKTEVMDDYGLMERHNEVTFINENSILENVANMSSSPTQQIHHEIITQIKPKIEEGFFCNRCSLCFPNFEDLEIHVKIHFEEKPMKCSSCSKWFENKQSKDKHMRKHGIITDIFTCDVCGKMFSKKRHLRNHIKAHTDVKEHQCPFCPADFYSYEDKRSHIRKKHAADEGFIVKCKVCQKIFYDKEILEKHQATHGKNNILNQELPNGPS